MGFWGDVSSDFDGILSDAEGAAMVASYTPHTLPVLGEGESFTPYSIPVILISQGRDDDANTYKSMAHLYFSKNDISDPKYQDTVTVGGESWKLMRDAGSNNDLMRWEVERDIRSKFSEGQR